METLVQQSTHKYHREKIRFISVHNLTKSSTSIAIEHIL